MSAQGRITGQLMEKYCEQQSDSLQCRLITGDLWWITGSLLLLFLIGALLPPAINSLHTALKNGKLLRLLSWPRFWRWFRQKGNTLPTTAIAAIPTIMFLSLWLLMPVVFAVSAFCVYLFKNWKTE